MCDCEKLPAAINRRASLLTFNNPNLQKVGTSSHPGFLIKSISEISLRDYYLRKFMESKYYTKVLSKMCNCYAPDFSIMQRYQSVDNKVFADMIIFRSRENKDDCRYLTILVRKDMDLFFPTISEISGAFLKTSLLNGEESSSGAIYHNQIIGNVVQCPDNLSYADCCRCTYDFMCQVDFGWWLADKLGANSSMVAAVMLYCALKFGILLGHDQLPRDLITHYPYMAYHVPASSK